MDWPARFSQSLRFTTRPLATGNDISAVGVANDRPAQKIADQVNETLAKFNKDFKVT